ncbi:hypothetical protein CEXT_214531 [Caerostris extrusa]|uniref:Uncharacterized protein n=1 Tax=Caerostris extrusa TaxID=172846 RepID=A0AAV4S2C3_CAEEX|nr:hypothetical protein CEXT_214531 [Caerostris extrusa]
MIEVQQFLTQTHLDLKQQTTERNPPSIIIIGLPSPLQRTSHVMHLWDIYREKKAVEVQRGCLKRDWRTAARSIPCSRYLPPLIHYP